MKKVILGLILLFFIGSFPGIIPASASAEPKSELQKPRHPPKPHKVPAPKGPKKPKPAPKPRTPPRPPRP
jgi:hypothetical protein